MPIERVAFSIMAYPRHSTQAQCVLVELVMDLGLFRVIIRSVQPRRSTPLGRVYMTVWPSFVGACTSM